MSFMRVSAFAMNHAALMGTVFIFARMLGGENPQGVGKVVWGADVVIGNIMVMCLEGIMVFVQVLRLHYYEFFSKFFHHQGRPFEPLTLRVGRSAV
jgi:V/A-type H+-transporting ATPase subunit I